MTVQSTQQAVPTGHLAIDQLGHCVEELVRQAGHGCLIESSSGRLLTHQLLTTDLPDALLAAVVGGHLAPLHRGLAARRTTGLLASGPVIEGDLDGLPLAYLGLTGLGGIWLLTEPDRPLDLSGLREPVDRLAGLLALTGPDVPLSSLAACLRGESGALPPHALARRQSCWVAAVKTETRAELTTGMFTAMQPAVVDTTWCGSRFYVVVSGSEKLTREHVLTRLQACVDRASTTVTVGLSEQSAPTSLAEARQQADLACDAARPGTCAALSSVRSVIVVQRMANGAAELSGLGPDPLQRLLDHDARRGSHLVSSLHAWLDTFGDIPLAAELLAVHPNTLRYRLRRAREVLQLDLQQDSHARVEIHSRLLASGRA